MQLMNGIQHVSFDLWLTLIKSNPEFKPLRNKLFAKHFAVQQPEDAVTKAFRHFDILFNQINERAGGNVHYTEMLYVILDNLGVPIAQVSDEAMLSYYKEMEKLFYDFHPQLIDAQTIDVLKSLQDKGCSINILSNTGFILGATLRPLLGILKIEEYFDFQLYSDEMGNSKPSSKVYHQVFVAGNKIKTLTKSDILHLGDNAIADVQGAAQYGFKSAIIDRTNTLSKIFLN